ncbi:MAG: DNA-directed RNA polymerase subunit N [Candidatus Nanohaloarchaeota archaeon QJJ-5]|nr:DNA-directed RNA polymerase subunit N [Candidatus Nanohaloarchaeota archaeon QJJ-5]
MIVPVRCFSCGRVLGDKWDEFKERTEEQHEDAKQVLDDLGIDSYCCRSVMLTHVDLIEDVAQYKKI